MTRFNVKQVAVLGAGVIGMTKVAALELAPLGIRVNAVCPAPTATEMMFNLERTQSPERIAATMASGLQR